MPVTRCRPVTEVAAYVPRRSWTVDPSGAAVSPFRRVHHGVAGFCAATAVRLSLQLPPTEAGSTFTVAAPALPAALAETERAAIAPSRSREGCVSMAVLHSCLHLRLWPSAVPAASG